MLLPYSLLAWNTRMGVFFLSLLLSLCFKTLLHIVQCGSMPFFGHIVCRVVYCPELRKPFATTYLLVLHSSEEILMLLVFFCFCFWLLIIIIANISTIAASYDMLLSFGCPQICTAIRLCSHSKPSSSANSLSDSWTSVLFFRWNSCHSLKECSESWMRQDHEVYRRAS